ncbi:hypothetical protein [Coleofasciculus sp. FACHB-129]|nr:hypothetical protein [Coleofasciculus sp. FACHB-129]MBD1893801.1 hypothetical protein [Coleofasciculus sp. FACHB-129]
MLNGGDVTNAIASSNKLARTDNSALRYRIFAKFWLHVEARSPVVIV